MDRATLRTQINRDEGKRLRVYRDTLDHLTVGVGHLVVPRDQLTNGQWITEERCTSFFEQDITTALPRVRGDAALADTHLDNEWDCACVHSL